VHHTRDSYTKEWLDTLDKALRGWAAFLRLMLPHVMNLPCFASDWCTLMDVLQGLITMQNLPEDSASRKVRRRRTAPPTARACGDTLLPSSRGTASVTRARRGKKSAASFVNVATGACMTWPICSWKSLQQARC